MLVLMKEYIPMQRLLQELQYCNDDRIRLSKCKPPSPKRADTIDVCTDLLLLRWSDLTRKRYERPAGN